MMTVYAERLTRLRQQLVADGVDGFLVPHADEFQSEYLPASAERLVWITGFTGSSGAAVILKDKSVAMTDGRYTIQIRRQVDAALYEIADSTQTSIGDWLFLNAGRGQVIGYDPKLHTAKQIEAIADKAALKGIVLRALYENPLDKVWEDRPSAPMGLAEVFPDDIAGLSSAEKRRLIADAVRKAGGNCVVLALPDSVAWLLNIRGCDVAHNPLVLSSAILYAEDSRVDWFVDPAKIPEAVRHSLGEDICVKPPSALEEVLAHSAGVVLVDFARSPLWYVETLTNAGVAVRDAKDPCILPKACKTLAEQEAMRRAHIRDGVAVVKFLAWLDAQDFSSGRYSELTLVDKLEEMRRVDSTYRDSSFDTICGWAAHGAIIHYRATPETNQAIGYDNLLLLDSGAQYRDGTTDVTRTIVIGQVSERIKECFTRVLKGHINLARAQFPEGTNGAQLDTLARQPLWDVGLDYAHGTGHGVGCYLSVHEEAASISPRGVEPVRAGMIISNEPGFYAEGEFGIRHESLVLCQASGVMAGSGRALLGFETLTLVPFDLRGIETELMTVEERAWLNAYHERVRHIISPHLTAEERAWLVTATVPI